MVRWTGEKECGLGKLPPAFWMSKYARRDHGGASMAALLLHWLPPLIFVRFEAHSCVCPCTDVATRELFSASTNQIAARADATISRVVRSAIASENRSMDMQTP